MGEWEKIVERKVSAKCVVRKIRAEGEGRVKQEPVPRSQEKSCIGVITPLA